MFPKEPLLVIKTKHTALGWVGTGKFVIFREAPGGRTPLISYALSAFKPRPALQAQYHFRTQYFTETHSHEKRRGARVPRRPPQPLGPGVGAGAPPTLTPQQRRRLLLHVLPLHLGGLGHFVFGFLSGQHPRRRGPRPRRAASLGLRGGRRPAPPPPPPAPPPPSLPSRRRRRLSAAQGRPQGLPHVRGAKRAGLSSVAGQFLPGNPLAPRCCPRTP